jgi:hypothetical protein
MAGITCMVANVTPEQPILPASIRMIVAIGVKLNMIDADIVATSPTIAAIMLDKTMFATKTSNGTGIIACRMFSLSLGSLG